MNLLSLAVTGNVEQWQREEIALKRKADIYALAVGSQTLRDRLSKTTAEALGTRLGRAWKQRLYQGASPAAMVWTRAPNIITTFMADTVIVPKKGKHIAVPTGFNREGGRRGAKVRVTPKQMIASGMSFTRPREEGGLIWFLRVTFAQGRNGKKGYVRDMAFAGGLVSVGRTRRRNVRKWEVSAKEILAARAVPMFVLLDKTRFARRLDLQAEARRIEDEIPGYLAEGYQIYDTGSSS